MSSKSRCRSYSASSVPENRIVPQPYCAIRTCPRSDRERSCLVSDRFERFEAISFTSLMATYSPRRRSDRVTSRYAPFRSTAGLPAQRGCVRTLSCWCWRRPAGNAGRPSRRYRASGGPVRKNQNVAVRSDRYAGRRGSTRSRVAWQGEQWEALRSCHRWISRTPLAARDFWRIHPELPGVVLTCDLLVEQGLADERARYAVRIKAADLDPVQEIRELGEPAR